MEVTGHANPTKSRWMKVMSRSWSLSEPLCRVCLATAPTSACLPDIRTLPEGLQQFIIDLTSLQMQEDDGLPTGICTNCSDTVMKAYALRKLAQESDVKLRQIRNKPDGSETNSGINSKLEHQEEDKGKGCKRHKCLTCSKEFKFMSALVRHEETHEPQYKCTVCDKIFAFRSSFQRHKLQHTRGGPVLCKLCGSHFLDDMLLRRHINYAHNQKKYGCEVCGGKFSTAAALKSHSKSHIARHERALRCRYDGCGRSFNFAHHLKHHEMTHTGKKQYFCDECGKGFVQSHHLSAHIKQHQPHAWLQCETPSCGKILPSQYALKRHSAVHRKAKPKENNTCCDNTVCSTQKKSQCNKQSLQHKQSIENLKEATEITNKKLNDSLNDFQLNIISTKLTENSLQEINANSLSQDWNEKSNPPTSNIQEQLEISKLESVMDIEEMVTNTNINDNPKSCCSSRKASTVRVAPTTQTKCVVTVEDKLDGTDCKGFFGKCIVGSGTDGTNSEDCICAKVKYEVPIPEYLTAPLLTALEQQGYYPS